MKNKRIAIALITASIVSLAFLSTAFAATDRPCYLSVTKKGNDLAFSIWTTSYSVSSFSGTDVDRTSIVLHITDAKGTSTTYAVDPNVVTILQSADYVTFTLNRLSAGFPPHADCYATGSIATGDHAGDTFTADGPGWGWGNIH